MRLVTPTRQINTRKSIEDQKEHAREAVRLRSLASTVTTGSDSRSLIDEALLTFWWVSNREYGARVARPQGR